MALSIGGPYPRETPGQEPGTQGSRQMCPTTVEEEAQAGGPP